MARMAGGHAADLATTVLLATTLPILIAPAMNVQMWAHPATRRNLATLEGDGVRVVGPNAGTHGGGRDRPRPHGRAQRDRRRGGAMLAETMRWAGFGFLAGAARAPRAPAGRRVLVTSGPTHEPIDPVRYHRQPLVGPPGPCHRGRGRAAGAAVTLVSGPVAIPDPPGVDRGAGRDRPRDAGGGRGGAPGRHRDLRRGRGRLAAGAPRPGRRRSRRTARGPAPLPLVENPDILATIARMPTGRPPPRRRASPPRPMRCWIMPARRSPARAAT